MKKTIRDYKGPTINKVKGLELKFVGGYRIPHPDQDGTLDEEGGFFHVKSHGISLLYGISYVSPNERRTWVTLVGSQTNIGEVEKILLAEAALHSS